VVVRELGCVVGGRLPAQDFAKSVTIVMGVLALTVHQGRLAEDMAAASLLARLVPHLIERLADRDRGQEPPEVVATVELRELPPAGAIAEALERAQRHVLFIKGPTAMGGQLRAGQSDQSLKVTIPQALDVIAIAGLDATD